jgi:hypothetical protein
MLADGQILIKCECPLLRQSGSTAEMRESRFMADSVEKHCQQNLTVRQSALL